jgi:lipopolysaccharide export system protein LptA
MSTTKRKPATQGQGGKGGCGDVDHVEADGDVYFVTPEQTVRGDHAVYTYYNDTSW